MDPFESIKATFFQECDELLTDLESGLLAMERGDNDPETINAVFRAVHSVKGGAGAFGLEGLIRFAHVFETVLDKLRGGQLAPNDELAKILLRANDILADHVQAARSGGTVEQARSAAMLEELEGLIGEEAAALAPLGEDEDDDDFDDGGGMSISALEAELRDGVMEVLDAIAADFGGFRKLQDKLVEARLKGETLSAKDQKAYDTLTADISGRLKTMKLNNNRIEALVEQLYAINKRLIGLEGRLLRLADSYGISRPEFLKAYFGKELEPTWRVGVKDLGVRCTKFSDNESAQIGAIRGDVAAVATEAG
ncbi:MAG: Hpt domain-containing protein, partial [Phenylobacterium sp.]